jgi:polysaccharide biosynthesis/export protein
MPALGELWVAMRKQLAGLLLVGLLSASAAGDEYEIGPMDVLRVAVLGQSEMSGDFALEPDGTLNFPFVGRIKASEMTAQELEKKLVALLSDGYLKKPQVAVTVKEYRSQRIFVTGEVQRPGPYSLHADRTLLGLITEMGALGANAGHEIIVVRAPEPPPPARLFDFAQTESARGDDLPLPAPKEEVFRVKLAELQSGRPDVNLTLKAGDTVRVPKAANIFVSGFVSRPGSLRWEEGTTVFQALNLAGGVNERGSSGRVKLVRLVDGKKVEIKAAPTDTLLPGDVIVVPEKLF